MGPLIISWKNETLINGEQPSKMIVTVKQQLRIDRQVWDMFMVLVELIFVVYSFLIIGQPEFYMWITTVTKA